MRHVVWLLTAEAIGLIIGVYFSMPLIITILLYAVPVTLLWLVVTSASFLRRFPVLHFVRVSISSQVILLGVGVIFASVTAAFTWNDALTLTYERMGLDFPKNRYIAYRQFHVGNQYHMIVEAGIKSLQFDDPVIDLDLGVIPTGEYLVWDGPPNELFGISPHAKTLQSSNPRSKFQLNADKYSVRPNRSLYLYFTADEPFSVTECSANGYRDVIQRCGESVELIELPMR